MKKNLLLIICFIFLTSEGFSQADSIPNKGFNYWTSHGSYDEPDNWATLNSLSVIGYPVTVTKSTDKNSGPYAIRLESKSYTDITAQPPATKVQAGLASLGTVNIVNRSISGYPYTKRPASLTGYYKCAPSKGDNAAIGTVLTKWNSTKSKRDTIAFGVLTNSNAVISYTKFTINLLYYANPATPDSAIIILSASNIDNPVSGSILFVDDLAFEGGTTGIFSYHATNNSGIVVYPNPASTETHLKNLPSVAGIIELNDFTGRTVETIAINGRDEIEIRTQGYLPGIYLYSVRNNQGERIATGKFTIGK